MKKNPNISLYLKLFILLFAFLSFFIPNKDWQLLKKIDDDIFSNNIFIIFLIKENPLEAENIYSEFEK